MPGNNLLEIIAFDIASCAMIEANGGDRIELCANPEEGGTTVSYGMMKAARKAANIPIFPIIRPRGGNFFYNDEEYAVMRHDLLLAKETGMDGVVIGLLHSDRTVDFQRTAALVELAYPMEVTFHRAFDAVADWLPALEAVITAGCNRILTSGGAPVVSEGLERLKDCIKAADDRIIILPGSGIRAANIQSIYEQLGVTEYHSSARYLSPETNSYSLDVAELGALRTALPR